MRKLFFATILSLGIVLYFFLLSKEEESSITKLDTEIIIDPFIVASSPRKECECDPIWQNQWSKPEVIQKCSMCSDEATFLGPGQRVISYSFYKSKYLTRPDKNPKTNYYKGISQNLNAMREVYPGWVMRVYSNLTFTPGDETCNLICSNQEDLYWCDVSKIKNPRYSSVSANHVHGWFWRFFPINDPLVSIFLSRDLDCLLGTRERNAEKDWEERKDKVIHLMRDHPTGHKTTFLAGMWGMRNDDGLISEQKRKEILETLVELQSTETYGVDQYALNKVLYTEEYFHAILAHDSFFCGIFNETDCIPFPDGGWDMEHPISYVGQTHF